MKPRRQLLSDEDLRAYSAEHLWYECWMFFETGSTLPGGVTSPLVQFVDNAVLESFAIHLRNLLDFFYPERILPDDVIAADYFELAQMPATFPVKSELLNEAEVRAHKHVSHLTAKRLPGHHADKRWHVAPLVREVANLIDAFIAAASPQKLDADFVVRVKQLLQAVKEASDS